MFLSPSDFSEIQNFFDKKLKCSLVKVIGRGPGSLDIVLELSFKSNVKNY